MNISKTSRGFGIMEFLDANGETCTIQESSAYREEGLIWLGAKEVEVKGMGVNGWESIDFTKEYGSNFVGNQRMHLSQSDVKDLLPLLTYFAEHGHLPEENEIDSKD